MLDNTSRLTVAEQGTVVGAIGNQVSGRWQRSEHETWALVVAHLAFRQEQDDGSSVTVANGAELRVQLAFGSPDTTMTSPF